jgi:hypothetical protein
MNTNSNSNREPQGDSILIKILSLEKEYKLTLNQYEQAYQTYISLLKSHKQTMTSNYTQASGPGGICTGSSGFFPDGMWEKNAGSYPQDQCQALCDDNPNCSGYNLGVKDSNGNFSCSLFADKNTQITLNSSANGCYRKKTFSTSSSNKISNNNRTAEFISLRGKNFWGTAPLSQGRVNSIQECENMCGSDINCTGATFQSSNNLCFTRTGMAEVVNGQSSDYALVPQIRQILNTLQNLNNQLLNINQQIDTQMQSLYPIAQQDQINKNAKQLELNDNYMKLLEEQNEITVNLQEYETLEEKYDNNSLNVNQKNILYKFWTLLAILLLAITFKIIFKVDGDSLIFFIFTVLSIMICFSLDWWALIPIILLPFLFKMIYYP